MIRAKLKDRSGASITYALLLFLVCAVVSSVVITAGTAAAGRMSRSVDTDERYYNVTSAATLLIDLFDGVKIETQKVSVKEGTNETESVPDGYPIITKDDTTIPASDINNYSLLMLASRLKTMTQAVEESFPTDMEVKLESDKKCDVKTKYDSDSGRIIFAISNYDPESSGAYLLYLVFDADIKEVSGTKTESRYQGGELVPIETQTTTTSMTWTLTSMGTEIPEGWE